MAEPFPVVPELPMARPAGRPFDPPERLGHLRERSPLVRLRFPDGHLGWLATSHSVVRAVLADARFSTRPEITHSPVPGPAALEEFPPAEPGDFLSMDAPDHTRYRGLLAGKFTVRRMRLLTEQVERAAEERLDAMERHGPPVDLVTAYAQPIPALVICALLGVPYAEHEPFRDMMTTVTDRTATADEITGAFTGVGERLRTLVRDKRAHPTDDLLGDLATTDLTDDELITIGTVLIGAGLETTANVLALGTFALLTHPDQLDLWRSDGELTDRAVEELLRYTSITPTGVRTALEDVRLGDLVVRAGESVALSIESANRDPGKFPDPDTLDLTRHSRGHLSFGHGIHQCLGQQLARVELRVAFPALFRRFPTLRLAVPPDEVTLRQSHISGVDALPVTWEGA
ncbi:cytochrome P450 [Streptomyces sp. URMC 126]|uniref:cytochrome P450 n=1 Tax=Streptomyces sp. URMC 126 TaxID=3423401 RepID=UPI003F1987FF